MARQRDHEVRETVAQERRIEALRAAWRRGYNDVIHGHSEPSWVKWAKIAADAQKNIPRYK